MPTMPANVMAICKTSTEKYGDDVARATEQALAAIKKLPEFPDLVEGLLSDAVQGVIYDVRHRLNVTAKRGAGLYGPPPKVLYGSSKEEAAVHRSLYNLYIGGMRLGWLKGGQLAPLADSEEAEGNGKLVNAKLLRALDKLVPEGVEVRAAVSEKKLNAIARQIGKKLDEAA